MNLFVKRMVRQCSIPFLLPLFMLLPVMLAGCGDGVVDTTTMAMLTVGALDHITLSATNISLTVTQTRQITVTAYDNQQRIIVLANNAVAWKSSTGSIASVTTPGITTTVTGWQASATAVTITATATVNGITKRATASVNVSSGSGGGSNVNPKDGAAMVWVPAGNFIMGSPANIHVGQGDVESPQHTVYLDGYWIYKNDVTVAQYLAFCAATGHAQPPWAGNVYSWAGKSGWSDPSLAQHPIVNVTWNDAQAYAQWAGVHLPTEAQWEKAARGTDGRNYPWGGVATIADPFNGWDPTKCSNWYNSMNVGISTWPVGSFPAGASPYGAMDMVGNVWVWCADWWDPSYYTYSPSSNPTGPATGTYRTLRGGAWYKFSSGIETSLRCAFRDYYNPIYKWYDIGFRCVSSAPGP